MGLLNDKMLTKEEIKVTKFSHGLNICMGKITKNEAIELDTMLRKLSDDIFRNSGKSGYLPGSLGTCIGDHEDGTFLST